MSHIDHIKRTTELNKDKNNRLSKANETFSEGEKEMAKGRFLQAFDHFTDCLLYEQSFIKAHISRAAAVKNLPPSKMLSDHLRCSWMWCDYSQAILKTSDDPRHNYYTLRAISLTKLERYQEVSRKSLCFKAVSRMFLFLLTLPPPPCRRWMT